MTTPINRNRPPPPPPPPPAPKVVAKPAPPPAPPPAPAANPASTAVANTQKSLAKDPVGTVKQPVDTFRSVSDARSAINDVRSKGLLPTARQSSASAANPSLGSPTSQALKGVGLANNLAQLPGQYASAAHDIRQAFRPGATPHDQSQAINSAVTAGKTTLSSIKSATELARDTSKAVGTYKAAAGALESAAPGAPKAAAALAATKETLFGKAGAEAAKGVLEPAGKAATPALETAARKAATEATGQAAGEAALKSGAEEGAAKAAGEAAAKAAAEAGGKTLAKAAGRLVPGVNIAIAAADTANAIATVKDPNASTTKKVTSVVTAIGSAAAATDIPGVAQAGAAVSAVSSFVGGLFG